MPSDLSYWLISVPLQDHDPHRMMSELAHKLTSDGGAASNDFGALTIPPLKVSALSSQFCECITYHSDTLRAVSLGHTRVLAWVPAARELLLSNWFTSAFMLTLLRTRNPRPALLLDRPARSNRSSPSQRNCRNKTHCSQV